MMGYMCESLFPVFGGKRDWTLEDVNIYELKHELLVPVPSNF